MKKTFILTILLVISTMGYASPTPVNRYQDDFMHNIQDKIYIAFFSSFKNSSPKPLIDIEQTLSHQTANNQLITYWIAYTKYYQVLYYLKSNNKKLAINELNSAIESLDQMPNKNSETYAFLAHLQGFSIQYVCGLSAASISSKVKRNAEIAIQLDSSNLRAWYVLASNDFYTPIAFGGMQKCEQYLQKATSLKEQSIPNSYMPSWGKNDAYAMLIGYYINKKHYPKAKEALYKGLLLYPNDYPLRQYEDALKNK